MPLSSPTPGFEAAMAAADEISAGIAALQDERDRLMLVNQALVKALKSAKYAINGREHTGFIDAALKLAGDAT